MKGRPWRWRLAAVGILGVGLGAAGYGVFSALLRPPSLTEPTTVIFCRPSGSELRMDLYAPEHATTAAVLYFHGGAWSSGDRSAGTWFPRIAVALIARGITVASADYRLAPEWPWPAQRDDAYCALRYLKAQGFTDLAVMGESSGGQLAAVLGNEQPLAAAVDLWGPTELSAIAGQYQFVFPDEAALDEGSPARHPTGRTPILTVTGSDDQLIPPEATLALADALAAMGIPSDRLVISGAGHSMEEVDPRRLVDPVVDFLSSRLGP